MTYNISRPEINKSFFAKEIPVSNEDNYSRTYLPGFAVLTIVVLGQDL